MSFYLCDNCSPLGSASRLTLRRFARLMLTSDLLLRTEHEEVRLFSLSNLMRARSCR